MFPAQGVALEVSATAALRTAEILSCPSDALLFFIPLAFTSVPCVFIHLTLTDHEALKFPFFVLYYDYDANKFST